METLRAVIVSVLILYHDNNSVLPISISPYESYICSQTYIYSRGPTQPVVIILFTSHEW